MFAEGLGQSHAELSIHTLWAPLYFSYEAAFLFFSVSYSWMSMDIQVLKDNDKMVTLKT